MGAWPARTQGFRLGRRSSMGPQRAVTFWAHSVVAEALRENT